MWEFEVLDDTDCQIESNLFVLQRRGCQTADKSRSIIV